jgi:hypothetical protein
MTLEGVDRALDSRFASHGSPALLSVERGRIVAADGLQEPVSEGDLVTFRFRLLDPTGAGRVEVLEALVADGAGTISRLGSSAAEARVVPAESSLGANYPNPFNPDTVVPFALSSGGKARLAVYSLLGQEVAVLVDGVLPAGNHRVAWDGRDALGRSVASGTYILRIEAGRFTAVRKLMLLK